MNVYKINDVINCEFLKIPKSMFAKEDYRKLSSDAKLTFALLYDRLSLSKLNGWINENDEVYLIYTREEIAEDLGITYKKSISAFKELVDSGLISEKRCGRGIPNRIYIVKPEINEDEAKRYVKNENKNFQNGISKEKTDAQDVPKEDVLICQTGISETAVSEYQDVPKRHTNKTNINKTYESNTENSQSVSLVNTKGEERDRRTDEIYSFDDILKNCQLHTFPEDERKMLYDALERLFYCEKFKIGNAVLPQDKVRSRMYEIDASILQSVIYKLHKNQTTISNITAYVMSTIFNTITEEYSIIHVDPYLNSLREKSGEG